MRQPFACPASCDIHANDIAAIRKICGKCVEIAAVSRETVHAKDKPATAGVTPFRIGDFMKSARAKALKAA
jgi:hypothetical protein